MQLLIGEILVFIYFKYKIISEELYEQSIHLQLKLKKKQLNHYPLPIDSLNPSKDFAPSRASFKRESIAIMQQIFPLINVMKKSFLFHYFLFDCIIYSFLFCSDFSLINNVIFNRLPHQKWATDLLKWVKPASVCLVMFAKSGERANCQQEA